MNTYSPALSLSLESIWLQTFWQYITASIQSGKAYLPHEQSNIAVYLADSVKQAYMERFGAAVPQGGGSVAPQASNSAPALFDALDAPRTPPSVMELMDQALSKMQAATNNTPQFKPSRPKGQ